MSIEIAAFHSITIESVDAIGVLGAFRHLAMKIAVALARILAIASWIRVTYIIADMGDGGVSKRA